MLPPVVRVFVALDAVDMRKSFDGLAAAVQSRMGLDPLSGHLYVFLNHRRNLMKMLFFDRTGYCILYKRLEKGTFQLPRVVPGASRIEVESAELAMILEGIDLESAKRRMRFRRPATPTVESGI